MTYLDLIDNFWKKNQVSPFSSTEIAFYFYLLKECASSEWRNPFRLPTRKICFELNFRKDTITSVRNSLMQKGLIHFKKGNRRSADPEYTLLDWSGQPYQKPDQNSYQKPYQRVDQNQYQNMDQKPELVGIPYQNGQNEQVSPPYNPPIITKTTDRDLKKEKTPIGVKKKELSLFGGAEAARTYNGISIEYVADGFYPIFLKWLEYKKQRRESYKSERSLKTCYNQLVKYAEGSAAYADYIVDRSIANNWQGLFPLKQGDIDFLKKQSNGNARLEPNRAATVPRRTADDYDEEDD